MAQLFVVYGAETGTPWAVAEYREDAQESARAGKTGSAGKHCVG